MGKPKAVKIFLASSSELKDDREAFASLVGTRNNEWAERGVFLKLIRWEDFFDAMSPTRLQDEYNKAIRGCDIFVMLLFTKVGKYTGEEFEIAFEQFQATHKPFIFTYFKDAPVDIDSIDPADLASLRAFKQKLEALGHFQTKYKSLEELQLHFHRQLDKLAASGSPPFDSPQKNGDKPAAAGVRRKTRASGVTRQPAVAAAPQPARSSAGAQQLRRAYLDRILRQADQLPLFAGDSANAQVRLSAVYTALLTSRTDDETASGRTARQQAASPEREARKLSALDVLNAEPRLVLLGGPGSGKSTFVNFVALSMAGELLGAADGPNLATLTAPVPREDGDRPGATAGPEPQHWDHGALLPVQVVLRDLAARLPPPGQPVKAGAVWDFIRHGLEQATLGEFEPHLHEELLERGGLVLLDGLDEVPDADDRRGQIKQAVQDFAATFRRCRFLVTSRTYAYQKQDWKLDGFAEVQLLPFTPGQIGRFVDAWYAHMVGLVRLTGADARDRAEVLKREVGRSERLRELAERPLLLTLIAQLQTEGGGRLPEKREELYDRAVDMLLTRWEALKVRVLPDGTKQIEPSLAEYLAADRQAIRKQLNRLAFEAHRDQPRLVGTADILQSHLTDALFAASGNPDAKLGRLIEFLRDRAGLLAAHGVGMYQFPHRSFQEYLAACHLTDDEFPDKLADLARADPNRWREVTLLAAAKAARGSSLTTWALGETLCPAPPREGQSEQAPAAEADHWGALLAGRVLAECADLGRVAARDAAKRERVRDWQLVIMRGAALPGVERALAGRTLAVLGDPRPETMTLDAMQFCLVPAGAFVTGDDQGPLDHAKPEHRVELAYPYFIGRFPVTVAQWREYLRDAGRLPPEDDEAAWSLRGRDNDPVVYVSWHDAMSFCRALTKRWKRLLPACFEVVLPSEAEWEKAARGGEFIPAKREHLTVKQLASRLAMAAGAAKVRNLLPRRTYPWGDARDARKANTIESYIGETCAVGCYPAGSSPCGCEDMSGNVSEWTRSLWGEEFAKRAYGYPYLPDDLQRENLNAPEEVYRVGRGGAFDGYVGLVRCTLCYRFSPGYRYYNVGFRAVLRSVPVRQLLPRD